MEAPPTLEWIAMSSPFPVGVLKTFVQALYRSSGLSEADARLCAEVAVLQEMRGVKTHGLRRVAPTLERLKNGQITPRPNRTVLRDSGATVVIDGDYGPGILGCMDAMDRAIAKSGQFGIGIGIVIHNNHFQSAAPYCLRAVEKGKLGIAFSNTQASMGYPGALGRVIGNSPLGFAVPTAAGFPVVFDSAMTTSGGKLSQWITEGKSIPAALLGLDAQGDVSNDPKAVLEGGTPMPVGGHKGAGIAILVEILTGVLGGGAFLKGIVPENARTRKEESDSQCCIAIDIGHFMPVELFQKRMADFIADLKSNPTAPSHREILLPGENAQRHHDSARRDGVTLGEEVRQSLALWAERLQVPFPA